MSQKPREPRRKRLAAVEPPKPLLQVMPMGRVRLDPVSVREITLWVYAYACRYDRKASQTLRGLKGDERARVLGERRAAEAAIGVLTLFAAGLTDTVDVRLIDEAAAQWDSAFPPPEPPRDVLPFVFPDPADTLRG